MAKNEEAKTLKDFSDALAILHSEREVVAFKADGSGWVNWCYDYGQTEEVFDFNSIEDFINKVRNRK